MNYAAEGGHEALVRMLHDEWGATDIVRLWSKQLTLDTKKSCGYATTSGAHALMQWNMLWPRPRIEVMKPSYGCATMSGVQPM
jgi:hypothetical protein